MDYKCKDDDYKKMNDSYDEYLCSSEQKKSGGGVGNVYDGLSNEGKHLYSKLIKEGGNDESIGKLSRRYATYRIETALEYAKGQDNVSNVMGLVTWYLKNEDKGPPQQDKPKEHKRYSKPKNTMPQPPGVQETLSDVLSQPGVKSEFGKCWLDSMQKDAKEGWKQPPPSDVEDIYETDKNRDQLRIWRSKSLEEKHKLYEQAQVYSTILNMLSYRDMLGTPGMLSMTLIILDEKQLLNMF